LDPGTVYVRFLVSAEQGLENSNRRVDVLQATAFWGQAGIVQVQKLDLGQTVLSLRLLVSFERGWRRHNAKST
jgi:hypothetical protein